MGLENAGLENDGQTFSQLWAKLRGLENAARDTERHRLHVGLCVRQSTVQTSEEGRTSTLPKVYDRALRWLREIGQRTISRLG